MSNQDIIDLMNENARLKQQLVKAQNPEAIKKAIDKAFGAKGLYIDWRLRDDVVKAVLSLTDDQGTPR